MTDFERLVAALAEAGVEFVIVGGLAATAHGSARLTQDIDVVYDLPWLIRVKRAAGRPKDLEVIAELEALLDERDKL